ncbi:MAG: 6-carboxytetrahydropterin synthase [bacterium]|nr:6-carboxytetrahydropterin synthase [bacterium]
METIRIEGHFHAGHRQLEYKGKCAWVHGHTWREGVVVIPGDNPSVENVVQYCLNKAVDVLARSLKLTCQNYRLEVTIQETDNNRLTADRTIQW